MDKNADTPVSAVVTGDIVLDCHLYGGIKTAATSFREPGTAYFDHLGGAALSNELLFAAADAKGAIWDKRKKDWGTENKMRAEKGKEPLACPDDIVEPRPNPEYEVHLGIDPTNLKGSLSRNLHSFRVWTPHPFANGSIEKVWRVQTDFGYGQNDSHNSFYSAFSKAVTAPTNPNLVLLDDSGILFRQESSKSTWPNFSTSGRNTSFYILKMSPPLFRGDLWPALIGSPVRARLLVLVSAADLRREDAQIRSKQSWEQCANDTLRFLYEDSSAKQLLNAAHVVISFGSAGALWLNRSKKGVDEVRLIFDPVQLEGEFERQLKGSVYGFQSCMVVAIAHHFLVHEKKGSAKSINSLEASLETGIIAGIIARRRLLELGHGPIDGEDSPGFPIARIGQAIASDKIGGCVSVSVPTNACEASGCPWTILASSEHFGQSDLSAPLVGLAQLIARYGRAALSHVPSLEFGGLISVDRTEIEDLRTIEGLIRSYVAEPVQTRPLSIGVFGPPGSGKSFGVKAIARDVLTKESPFIEFNLSQFKSTDELIGAFHRVRDAVLKGVTPVAFWDEFDSQEYKWLQYLLAPMQDGSFQEGQITHPIGKCVFIFAGATSSTRDEFGVRKPALLTPKEFKTLSPEEQLEHGEECERYRKFKFVKGPDFVSRLHGHLNVLGPNENIASRSTCPDVTWPIRRALLLRGILGLRNEELDMDPGLLFALLSVSCYNFGARSFEKILNSLKPEGRNTRFVRSSLPPDSLLACETEVAEFHNLMDQRNAFKAHPNIEDLAAAVNSHFVEGAEKARLEAEMKNNPHLAWTIDPAITKVYNDLSPDYKAANRAAARRIADHLALIDFALVPQPPSDKSLWKIPLEKAIKKHLERLAQAEHLGWCSERLANGWTFAKVRNNRLKQHNALANWGQLSRQDQDKDRKSVSAIPGILDAAKFKAVPISKVTKPPAKPTSRENRYSRNAKLAKEC